MTNTELRLKNINKLRFAIKQYNRQFNKQIPEELSKFLLDSNIVEIPAIMGQPVYFIDVSNKSPLTTHIEAGTVSMLTQKSDGSWKIRVSYYGVFRGKSQTTFDWDDLGSKWFFDKNLAESVERWMHEDNSKMLVGIQ